MIAGTDASWLLYAPAMPKLLVVRALSALLLTTACTSQQVPPPDATRQVPAPDLKQFLHANYSVSRQFPVKVAKAQPAAVVIVSSGPGLTPDTPVQGGTQDIQVLTYDTIAKRWNLVLDAANKVVPVGFAEGQANDPASSGPVALLPQDHPISKASAQAVEFQPDQTSLVIYGIDSSTNHPPGVLAIVNLTDTSPQVSYYDSESNQSEPKVAGAPGNQRLTVSASFAAPGDPGCCPVRNYLKVIASTDDGHSSPPKVGVVEDDRPWLGAYVAQDPNVPGVVAVVGTADGSPASSLLHLGDRVLGLVGESNARGTTNVGSPLFDMLGLHKPGDKVTLLAERLGKRLQLPVTLASYASPGFTTAGAKQASIGVEVTRSPVGSSPAAVVISKLMSGGAALASGLEVGMTILQVGDVVVHDPLDLEVGLWGHAFQTVNIKILQTDGRVGSGSVTPTQDKNPISADPL